MYCRECGEKYSNENAVICVKCGTAKGAGNKYCHSCGEQTSNPNAEVCLKCGVSLKNTQVANLGTSSKNKIVAGLLAIFLGYLGIHRFYLGYNKIGIIQLVLGLAGIITCGLTTIGASIWAIVDAVLIFTDKLPDFDGQPLQ